MRDDLLLGLRVIVSLLVVVALIWLAARRLQSSRRGEAPDMRVVARLPLTRRSSLALVEVEGRRLLLGVGDAGVSLVSELGADADWDRALASASQPPMAPSSPEEPPRPPAAPAPGASRLPAPVHESALSGSVLSSTTWKQAWSALSSASAPSGRHRA